jgi:hypothetical protein
MEFKTFPAAIYYNPERHITLSVMTFATRMAIKGSKHFFIRAMETKGETGIYSRLQEISKFAEYLKQNLEDWHLQYYYISNLTPRIALNSFRHAPLLRKKLKEWETKSKEIAEISENDENAMREQLQLQELAGNHDHAYARLGKVLQENAATRERLRKLDSEWKGAASIFNDWLEKGYGIALVWTISTRFRLCETGEATATVSDIEKELKNIWSQSVKSMAHQQGLWLEEIDEPQYALHAEYAGFFHPSAIEMYKATPILAEFGKEIERYFNSRLQRPIERTGYTESSSSAPAEVLAAFLRQAESVDETPAKLKSKISYEKIILPVYLGKIALSKENRLESTSIPFIFDLSALTKHVLITGTSGSGKTRVAQLITEAAAQHVPVVILDPAGEFTGLIHPNPNAHKEREFLLRKGRSYSPVIYTLDDSGVQFQANILKKPTVTADRLESQAEDTATVLTELAGDARLEDIIRQVLQEEWEKGDSTFENFIDKCRSRAAQRKTAVKLDKLIPYRSLMSTNDFDIQTLLQNKITLLTFNSTNFRDSQKLMIMWFILRELSNYFLNQLHSDELKLLVVIDECHRFYSEGMPKSPAKALEDLNKEGRGKGLGMVTITQVIRDLPEIFTQADIRIMLKIAEGEIQGYAQKTNTELARRLRLLNPREGYVFFGSEQFFCKFRPTLSLPKGISSREELARYSSPEKSLQISLRQLMSEETVTKSKPIISRSQTSSSVELEDRARKLLAEVQRPLSISDLQRLLKVPGRGTITNLIDELQRRKVVKTWRVGTKRMVQLVDQVQSSEESHAPPHSGRNSSSSGKVTPLL